MWVLAGPAIVVLVLLGPLAYVAFGGAPRVSSALQPETSLPAVAVEQTDGSGARRNASGNSAEPTAYSPAGYVNRVRDGEWLDGVNYELNSIFAANGLGAASVLMLMSVLFIAGLVSGLSGFAFAAVAACILWLLPPLQAVPLIMLLSTCNQICSGSRLLHEMQVVPTGTDEGALPYIVGGLFGVPVGLYLLRDLPAAYFSGFLGAFLIAYSAFSLLKGDALRLKLSGWRPAVAVGALGGVVGGFSAFPGSMPVVYLSLLGKTKIETRGVTQPYILTLQVLSLAILATTSPGVFGGGFWLLTAMTLPAALIGTMVGVGLYQRLSDVNFRRAVLVLLIMSGTSLVAKSLVGAA